MTNKDEENQMIDKAIGTYINEMIKHTLKVYTLSVSLSERDPSSAYESIHESLEKVSTTSMNNFNVDWFEQLIQFILGKARAYFKTISLEDRID